MEPERPSGPGGGPVDRTELKSGPGPEPSRAKVRFTPGSMLADRYRIVALLGRGGMGEVYRAEDTKLGQQVALKFLPSQFAADREKLERLYGEVRLGRQVSHPNVCRMYDVAEAGGHHFISMEYIDGEDLGSLLRRIGKLPHEKALELARDLCAGLAAAHGLDIIHRDLKPANVMIDGRGDARITDFGLAVLAEDLETRREVAGTPAYMAPEQLSGGHVSARTDLYALGLILYEMFTGKQLFHGETFGDVASQHRASSAHSISRETEALDPAVQRVILRCLEEDPAKRPASIHSVIAAMPGGDPLQAAIEAGETPSPEMIAAAGSTGELKPSVAWPLLILTLLVLFGAAMLSPRVRLYGQTELPHEAFELAIRARQILSDAGLVERPGGTAWEFGVDDDYRLWKRESTRSAEGTPENVEAVFSPLIFGYREAPDRMASASAERVSGLGSDPALTVSGMAQMVLEPDGRLRRVAIVGPEELAEVQGAVSPDWSSLFEAASLDLTRARETAPRWRPPVGSDARFAWLVPVDGLREPVRVEAASLAGQPVWLEVFAPWRRATRPAFVLRRPQLRLFDFLFILIFVSSVIVAGVLASRNVRRGRGNRAGAWRVGAFVALSVLISLALSRDHFADAGLETPVIFATGGMALFVGAMVWVWYLALEPYLRRRWPTTLISWLRVLQRRWLDPLVGRDLMIGVLAGAAIRLLQFLTLAAPSWLGWRPPIPADYTFLELTGWRFTFGYTFQALGFSVMAALAWMIVLLVAHLLLRRRFLAVAVVFAIVALTFPMENYPVLEWPARVIVGAIVALVMVRYGLLALAALGVTASMFDVFPITLDPGVWYFDRSLLALALLTGLAIFGFVRALGQHALFGEPVLED